jgi:cytochrome c-type biogenesis protein CcsB
VSLWFLPALTSSLLFYGLATALYLSYGVNGQEKLARWASLATWAGFAANTVTVAARWYEAGRPPFSNIYEMLLSFCWTLAGMTLLLERRYHVRVVGTVTMPLAVLSVVLMQLLPGEARPLMPALQSVWLHIHVSLAMLAYAACAISFALAMMFLIQDRLETRYFQIATSALLALIYGSMLGRVDAAGNLRVVAWDAQQRSEIFFAEKQRLFVAIPSLGWLLGLVALAVVVPLVLSLLKQQRAADHAFFVGSLFQAIGLAAFVLRAKDGVFPGVQAPGWFATHLAASPFLLAGMVAGLLASLLYLLLYWRRDGLELMLPNAHTLDRLTYKTVGLGFPLLTLMIATGAYWANQTWGSYWSWDPKETWALITWLVYAGYLHMRITRGWRGRRAAYFAILGFAVVIFTFFGVTYLLPGLHAYA